jgi:hypothetical protein
MPQAYEAWLDQVRDALRSINMAMEDWQPIWSFDFPREHKAGTTPGDAVMKANRFWWHEQKKRSGTTASRRRTAGSLVVIRANANLCPESESGKW